MILLPLIATLLLGLLPPALLAQETEVTFPIAVVALDGSYDVAADGETCELAWESAGTPTLRISTSNGARFREDLVGGTLVTLPDVDAAQGCLFVVAATVPEARRYSVTIEGAELVEITSADLEDLEGAVVLPVAMDREGAYGLVTDDYLDLVLDDADGAPRPVETDPAPEPEPEPEGTPPAATAVPSAHDGKVIEADVLLFVYADFMVLTDEGCRVDALEGDAALVAESSSGVFSSTWTPRASGVPVDAAGSPVGEAGCVFQRTMRLPGADAFTFRFGGEQLAVVPFPDLEGLDGALLLAVDRNGNRTPAEIVTVTPLTDPAATPSATPAAMPLAADPGGTAVDGQHAVVGRVNLWLSGPEDAPFGCAAGPTRTGVYPGAQLVVRDAHEVIIGYGTLVFSDRSGASVCAFDVTFTVPEAELYVLELGNGDRHVVSRAELELWNWHVFIDTGWP